MNILMLVVYPTARGYPSNGYSFGCSRSFFRFGKASPLLFWAGELLERS